MSSQSNKKQSIDEHIRRIHPFGLLNPETYPPWTLSGYIKYLLWFPVEFPLTLLMCIVGFFLAGYAWLKLKRNTTVRPRSLRSDQKSDNSNSSKQDKDMISIVISCFNERHNIELCLLCLQKYCTRPKQCEIILVDGGSTDGWMQLLEQGILSADAQLMSIPTTIVAFSEHGCSGRGVCQNMHADTILFDGYDACIRETLAADDRIVIASFKFTVNRSLMAYPLVGIGCMELFARIRCV